MTTSRKKGLEGSSQMAKHVSSKGSQKPWREKVAASLHSVNNRSHRSTTQRWKVVQTGCINLSWNLAEAPGQLIHLLASEIWFYSKSTVAEFTGHAGPGNRPCSTDGLWRAHPCITQHIPRNHLSFLIAQLNVNSVKNLSTVVQGDCEPAPVSLCLQFRTLCWKCILWWNKRLANLLGYKCFLCVLWNSEMTEKFLIALWISLPP